MTLSLLVYVSVAALLCMLGVHVYQREQRLLQVGGSQLPFYSWEILAAVLLVAIVAGARYGTGWDTEEMYIPQYDYLKSGKDVTRPFENGFILISKGFAALKAHRFFYLGFWALLQAGFLYFGLRKRKFLYPWVGVNLMLGYYFVNWCNSIRQVVVATLFVALAPMMTQQRISRYALNFLPFLLIVLLAATIHLSALLLLLFYWMPLLGRVKGMVTRTKLLSILAICVVVGLYPYWFKWLECFSGILEFVGYEKYDKSMTSLFDGHFRLYMGPLRLATLCTYVMVLWNVKGLLRHFAGDKLLRVFLVLAFAGMCGEALVVNTSFFVLRPFEYLLLFVLPLTGYTFVYLWRTGPKWLALAFAVLANSHQFITHAKMMLLGATADDQLYFLYHFFFMNN
ncbi:MAG: EpsG family protein [Muribaculaceae bacterium]|nr:EpsG family protein [Muribaculaceae bacterium]